jgi:signal transduction histidine kinase/ligand-binding sensor domain-containing protein
VFASIGYRMAVLILTSEAATSNLPVKATTSGAEMSAISRAPGLGRAIVALGFLLAWCPSAFALDPSLDITQYAHTAWRIRDGFAKGAPNVFAQTPDGYFWLGTQLGLLHFDGVRSAPWQPPAGMALPDERIRALLVARNGTLWIGTMRGLASWDGIKLIQYPHFDETAVNALVEDREGTIWVGATFRSRDAGLLCAIVSGRTTCTGEDGSFPYIVSLYSDSHGVLWVANKDTVWQWKPEPPIAYPVHGEVASFQALSETATGAILVVTKSGLDQLIDGKFQDVSPPLMTSRVGAGQLLRDRDGALWLADSELHHVHEGRIDSFGAADGLSGDQVVRLFEDREGNVWVATVDGVDRFHGLPVTTYSARQGLAGRFASVLADKDGDTLVSTSKSLYWVHEGRVSIDPDRREHALAGAGTKRPTGDDAFVGPLQPGGASLFQDGHGRIWIGALSGLGYLDERGRFVALGGVPAGYIDSIAEDRDGNLWIAHRDAGLLRVAHDRVMQRSPWTSISQSGPAWCLAVDSVHGGLWLGFRSGGVVHFVDEQIRASYSVRDGLGKGSVSHLAVSTDGTLWAGTEGGLSRIKGGRIATLDRGSGLPCNAVHSMIHDDDGAFWVHTGCGLVRISKSDLDAWGAAVDHDNAPPRVRATVLDTSDGVLGAAVSTFSPTATKSRDGKLWFVTSGGVEVVDPRHLALNKLPPPVHIEQMTADRKTYDASSNLRLPPLIRDLEIDYTALSLVAPEKNLFRYKLEGLDRDWQDVGNRRQAFYNDLSPGNYRFRVMASNNSGVWNEQGAALDFSIAPAYWQTNWFRAACVAVFALFLWALYQLRLRQIARVFNARLEERVGERTRIARDLHDTMLQNFQGLLLRFQTVLALCETRPAEAKEVLRSSIDQTAQAITEGREAVQGLRASTVERNDLAQAITTLGEELEVEASSATAVGLHVEVEGTARNLHPIVRDEIYRVASEALRNAFRHAEAQQIEVEFRYDQRQFRFRVRDDGKGIDAKFLTTEGRTGHFGLHGMRERAKLMGGKLTVWTAAESGTEIELIIPAARAYAASPRRSWFTEKFSRKSVRSKS